MGALSGGVCLIRDANKCWVCRKMGWHFPVSVPSAGVGRDAGTVVSGEAAIGRLSRLPSDYY